MENELRFAVLIDADNVSEKYIKIILDETASSGIATYKRIYGDWTSQRMTSWKKILLDNSIVPMQQYSYTTGKNATDSAMIIDAMDILYSGNVDGFCIVSSDSDFTRLVARLRESGMQVIGMGESKTPQPFISACNQFKYLDLLLEQRQLEEAEEEAAKAPKTTKSGTRSRSTAPSAGIPATRKPIPGNGGCGCWRNGPTSPTARCSSKPAGLSPGSGILIFMGHAGRANPSKRPMSGVP